MVAMDSVLNVSWLGCVGAIRCESVVYTRALRGDVHLDFFYPFLSLPFSSFEEGKYIKRESVCMHFSRRGEKMTSSL